MTSEIKITIFIKCIIRSSRLKKVQSKFTTLQITFNFPFERKHKLITIAQFTKQSRIIQHPITREEKKNLNQHSELTIFLAVSATHYKNLSPRKGDQFFFRNFTISSINKPSNYKIADIYIYIRALERVGGVGAPNRKSSSGIADEGSTCDDPTRKSSRRCRGTVSIVAY